MKKRDRFAVVLCLFPLLGCQVQTTAQPTQGVSPSGQVTQNEDSYNKIITGGLGFNFGVMNTVLLEEKGFRKTVSPNYYSDIGEWVNNRNYKDEFFNFKVALVVSPISNIVKSIEGDRFYGKKNYINHFRSCRDDSRAIITQLESKYPSLIASTGFPNIYKQNEYSSSWYYEGVTRYKYSNAKKYLGRSVVVVCSIQKWEEKVIGSLLIVAYYETREIREKITNDQNFFSKMRVEKA